MTSRAVSKGMPLSPPEGFPDPGFESREKPRSSARLEKMVDMLTVTFWLVHIAYWLVVGGFLMLFPWLDFWEDNPLIYRFPDLRPIIINPFLKGAVLGLGIVNLIIGIQEIVRLQKGLGNYVSR